jgi:hypothetical protein
VTKADGSSSMMSTPNKVNSTKVDENTYKSAYTKKLISQMNEKLLDKEK